MNNLGPMDRILGCKECLIKTTCVTRSMSALRVILEAHLQATVYYEDIQFTYCFRK